MSIQSFLVACREERKKLKGLSLWGKIEYLVSYYLMETLFFAAAAILILAFVITMLGPKKKLLWEGVCVNKNITDEGFQYVTTEFLNYRNGDEKKEYMMLTEGRNIPFSREEQKSQSGFKGLQKLVQKLETGTVDYLIVNERAFAWFEESFGYRDIKQLLNEEQIEQYKDDFILDDEGYVIGLDISGWTFCRESFEAEGETYLAVPADSPHKELFSDFVRFLSIPDEEGGE